MEYLDRAGELFSRYGAKLYLDQVLAKKQILRAWEVQMADSTDVAKPSKVAIIGASGTYGKGILARAEEIGVEAVVITRSPHKFRDLKPTTTVVEAQLDEEERLKEAFTGCDGVISALGDDRKKRPKTHEVVPTLVELEVAVPT